MSSFWVGNLVRLRGIEPEDWEAFREFDDNTVDMRRADRIQQPFSSARQREWAEQASLKKPDGDRFQLAIESLADGALVGSVSTFLIDYRAGRFGERRFHKCETSVWAFNEPSLAFHRKLGFTEEGRLRDHEFFAGRHHDAVLFGMTAPEFAARRPFPSEI